VPACGGRYRIICRGSKALKFTPPLSAITAAVVGVIVNLAVFLQGIFFSRSDAQVRLMQLPL